MEDLYTEAVAALREALAEFDDDTSQSVAASTAEIFVKEMDKEGSFLQGIDPKSIAKVLFMMTTALILVRDQMVDDSDHLLECQEEGVTCEDDNCEYTHEEVDPERITALIEGYNVALAAVIGTNLTVADTAATDFDTMDWSSTDGTR